MQQPGCQVSAGRGQDCKFGKKVKVFLCTLYLLSAFIFNFIDKAVSARVLERYARLTKKSRTMKSKYLLQHEWIIHTLNNLLLDVVPKDGCVDNACAQAWP